MRFKILPENLEEVKSLIREYQIAGHLEIVVGGGQVDFVVDHLDRKR
jgi:hypothetical protein